MTLDLVIIPKRRSMLIMESILLLIILPFLIGGIGINLYDSNQMWGIFYWGNLKMQGKKKEEEKLKS